VKTTILSLVAACCLLGWAAWYVHVSSPVRPSEAPQSSAAPRPTSALAEAKIYDEVVQKGLDYLSRQQFEDGHWEDAAGNHPVALTGMAGLALLMDDSRGMHDIAAIISNLQREDRHSASVRKAADWLMAQSQAERGGLIFSGHASETGCYMQGHGLATIFLAGHCAIETDEARRNKPADDAYRKKLTEVLVRAVTYIVHAQSSQGGWHDTSKVEGHDFATVAATAIQVQALQAVENAGIPVPQDTLKHGVEYLKLALEKGMGPADTAAALACQRHESYYRMMSGAPQMSLENYRAKLPKVSDLQFGRDELAHCCCAQAVQTFGGKEDSKAHLDSIFERLRKAQNRDGSWPAGDGVCVGPVYSTAIWCIVLQLDNESHPSKQPMELIS
jgi:hypothetical protein